MSSRKQELTSTRRENVYLSMQTISILASIIQHEHSMENDVKLGKPEINMFANRILKDSIAIQQHLATPGKLSIQTTNKEFIHEYTGEMWRVVRFFMGLSIEQIKDYMDGVEKLAGINQ